MIPMKPNISRNTPKIKYTNNIIKPVIIAENSREVIRPVLKMVPKKTVTTKNKIDPPNKAGVSHPGRLSVL